MLAKKDHLSWPTLTLGLVVGVFVQSVGKTAAQTIDYWEFLTVNTEPVGARVYVSNQFVGQSPVKVRLGPTKLGWTNAGFFAPYRWLPNGEPTWTIKAFYSGKNRNGRPPVASGATVIRLSAQDSVLESACRDIGSPWWESPPQQVTARRTLLLTLKARQSGPGRRDAPQAGRPLTPRQEYERALAGYNAALEKLRNAKSLAALRQGLEAVQPARQPDRFGTLLRGLTPGIEAFNIHAAEQEVEIARQRLQRASWRMNNSEMNPIYIRH